MLTGDMINSVLTQASYLGNHQQISQSTSGLNAGLCWSVSHLLGSLLNFIRQDLNTDEAATHPHNIVTTGILSSTIHNGSHNNRDLEQNTACLRQRGQIWCADKWLDRSPVWDRVSHALSGVQCHPDHWHWPPDQRQIRRPGHCTMGTIIFSHQSPTKKSLQPLST